MIVRDCQNVSWVSSQAARPPLSRDRIAGLYQPLHRERERERERQTDRQREREKGGEGEVV